MAVYKQPISTRAADPNTYLSYQSGFYEALIATMDRLKYESDKCLYKNQGEVIARENFG